ncbi:MAG TPA: hypothetical protein VNQ76_01185 [Planctomicrobium sp.]|nr:hypothetical protein [Planctomicrobium sp.]
MVNKRLHFTQFRESITGCIKNCKESGCYHWWGVQAGLSATALSHSIDQLARDGHGLLIKNAGDDESQRDMIQKAARNILLNSTQLPIQKSGTLS